MKRAWILSVWLIMATAILGTPQLLAQASESWTAELNSPNAGRRAKAARKLGKSGDPAAIPALIAAVADPSEKVRREVVIALSSLRVRESLDGLIAATHDNDPEVRALAVKGLVGYYTGYTPSTGFAGFLKRTWRVAKGRFVEENVRIDPGVQVEPKVISALTVVLNDQRAIEAAREAADGLGILMARPAVPDLVRAAYSSDTSLALVALNALAKIKDRSAGPQLLNLLDSPDAEIKQEAAVTLGILRTSDGLPKLQAMFENNPEKRSRKKALEGLAYLGDPVSVPFFIKALWNSDAEIRASAAEGLGRAGQKEALAELERAVQVEREGDTRLAMQFAITALGKQDFFSTLVDELGSKRRGDYAQTYLIELSHDKGYISRLYPYMNSQDADVRRRLCTVLMFAGDETSIEPLERLSHDPNGDVAREALRALRAIRVRISASRPSASTGGGK